ncbi:hypothetical protein RIF29_27075 [Crotalaria pallida]|uniref:Uncharacterized protein n=1 Tax=Crotalaria pallida TaxID=3830 RepID=A0AAN9EVN7_CROPI
MNSRKTHRWGCSHTKSKTTFLSSHSRLSLSFHKVSDSHSRSQISVPLTREIAKHLFYFSLYILELRGISRQDPTGFR